MKNKSYSIKKTLLLSSFLSATHLWLIGSAVAEEQKPVSPQDSVKEVKSMTHRKNWPVKTTNELLNSPNPFSVEFYKLGMSSSQSKAIFRYFPSVEQPQSDYYLLLSSFLSGMRGHAIAAVYDYGEGAAKPIGVAGLYTTRGDGSIEPSISIGKIDPDFHINNVHSGFPHLIAPVVEYHKELEAHSGALSSSVADRILNEEVGAKLLIQLDEKQYQDVLTVIEGEGATKTVNANVMDDWKQKIIYTGLTKEELINYAGFEKASYDFVGEVYGAIGWDMPSSIGYPPQWPIVLYALNPPLGGSHMVSIDGNKTIEVDGLKTKVTSLDSDNLIDVAERLQANKGGVSVTEIGGKRRYTYEAKKVTIPAKLPTEYPISYHLKHYIGEVNEELLPNGTGVLTTDVYTYMGNFSSGMPNGEVDLYKEGEHVKTVTYVQGVPHGPYVIYHYGFAVEEGWYNDGDASITKKYAYAHDHIYYKPYGAPKYTVDYIYSPEGELTAENIQHSRRIWELNDDRKLYVDERGKAVMVFPNGDSMSGPYQYESYNEIPIKKEYAAAGWFYGRCSYYSKKGNHIIEGEYDKEKGDFKNGTISLTFFDSVTDEYVKRRAKYKNGKITVRKTTMFDAFLGAAIKYAEDGEVDLFKLSIDALNIAGDWGETAMGTSIPPLATTGSYSWEDEYESTDEIREAALKDKGYEYTPTPYEDLTYINREYTIKYKGEEIVLKMSLPMEGVVIVRNEKSGGGSPEDSRGSRKHKAFDYLSSEGRKIVAPVDGVVVHQGYHASGSYLRTIWIDTKAETGENIRVKIMYGKLNNDLDDQLKDIPLSERMKGRGVEIKRGDTIASAQSLDDWYNKDPSKPFVSDHIHMEVHVREDHMNWKFKNKVSNPPFVIPPSPVPRVEKNKKDRIDTLERGGP